MRQLLIIELEERHDAATSDLARADMRRSFYILSLAEGGIDCRFKIHSPYAIPCVDSIYYGMQFSIPTLTGRGFTMSPCRDAWYQDWVRRANLEIHKIRLLINQKNQDG